MSYDISQLEFLFVDDLAFLKDVIKQFIDDVSAAEHEIQQAYANGDFEQEKYHLHRIKSPINNFGAGKAAAIVTRLEEKANEFAGSDEHAQLLQQLNYEIVTVIAELKKDHSI